MTPLVRQALAADAGILANLNEYGQAPHVAARPDAFKATSLVELEQWFSALLAANTTRAFLAEVDGRAVGYVVAIARETAENPFCHARRWLELDQIAVATAHRGRGVARALTERVIVLARAEGFGSVELTSWAFNEAAQAVFAKLGFTTQRARFERRME